jgi:hypothetical protein
MFVPGWVALQLDRVDGGGSRPRAEQAGRPLDLVPANLLEYRGAKAYTADRPGEFSGGDVQVHPGFPRQPDVVLLISQGYVAGVTLEPRRTVRRPTPTSSGFGPRPADSRHGVRRGASVG